jgi:hypothetical protein
MSIRLGAAAASLIMAKDKRIAVISTVRVRGELIFNEDQNSSDDLPAGGRRIVAEFMARLTQREI